MKPTANKIQVMHKRKTTFIDFQEAKPAMTIPMLLILLCRIAFANLYSLFRLYHLLFSSHLINQLFWMCVICSKEDVRARLPILDFEKKKKYLQRNHILKIWMHDWIMMEWSFFSHQLLWTITHNTPYIRNETFICDRVYDTQPMSLSISFHNTMENL